LLMSWAPFLRPLACASPRILSRGVTEGMKDPSVRRVSPQWSRSRITSTKARTATRTITRPGTG
jgi:hypothetical protein